VGRTALAQTGHRTSWFRPFQVRTAVVFEGGSQALDRSLQLILGLLENDGVLDAFYQFSGDFPVGVANHDHFSKQIFRHFLLEFDNKMSHLHLRWVKLQVFGLPNIIMFLL
jgi:hypothetical protein